MIDASLDEVCDEGMILLEKAADIIAANANDCGAMGRALGELHDEHADFLPKLQATYGRTHGEAKRAVQRRLHDRYYAAWDKLRPGLQKCRDEPSMKWVSHELWGVN